MPRPVTRPMVPLQGGLAVLGLLGLALWPPATGAMMLVPLGAGDANAAARVALAGGAVLLGMGPIPGSLVVSGDRARIAARAGAWNGVIVAAPPAACGVFADPAFPT